MKCSQCNTEMEPLGNGDYQCPSCGFTEYKETEEVHQQKEVKS